jgi:hypothetical protein
MFRLFLCKDRSLKISGEVARVGGAANKKHVMSGNFFDGLWTRANDATNANSLLICKEV